MRATSSEAAKTPSATLFEPMSTVMPGTMPEKVETNGILALCGVGDHAAHLIVVGGDVDQCVEAAGDEGVGLIVGRHLIAVAVIGLDRPAPRLGGLGR